MTKYHPPMTAKGYTLFIFTGEQLKKMRKKEKKRRKKAVKVALDAGYANGIRDYEQQARDELAAAIYTAACTEPNQVNGMLTVQKSLVGQIKLFWDHGPDDVTYHVQPKSMDPS